MGVLSLENNDDVRYDYIFFSEVFHLDFPNLKCLFLVEFKKIGVKLQVQYEPKNSLNGEKRKRYFLPVL